MKCGVWQEAFTLVELLAVLALLGILSAVAMSRFVTPTAYEASRVAEFLLEEVRFGRKIALYRQDVEVVLQLRHRDDRLLCTVMGSGTVLRERNADLGSVVLTGNGQALADGDMFTVAFDGSGNARAVDWVDVSLVPDAGIGINIVGERAIPLCLYPGGFLHHGTCA